MSEDEIFELGTCRIVRNSNGKDCGRVCVLPGKAFGRNDIIWRPSDTSPARNLRSTAELVNRLKDADVDDASIDQTLGFVDAKLLALDPSRRRRAV